MRGGAVIRLSRGCVRGVLAADVHLRSPVRDVRHGEPSGLRSRPPDSEPGHVLARAQGEGGGDPVAGRAGRLRMVARGKTMEAADSVLRNLGDSRRSGAGDEHASRQQLHAAFHTVGHLAMRPLLCGAIGTRGGAVWIRRIRHPSPVPDSESQSALRYFHFRRVSVTDAGSSRPPVRRVSLRAADWSGSGALGGGAAGVARAVLRCVDSLELLAAPRVPQSRAGRRG